MLRLPSSRDVCAENESFGGLNNRDRIRFAIALPVKIGRAETVTTAPIDQAKAKIVSVIFNMLAYPMQYRLVVGIAENI